jgi:hypothetical protein
MTLVGDRQRDGAVRELRRHYADGRLDETELSDRLDLALRARSSWELAYALRRLPKFDVLLARGRHVLLLAAVGTLWVMLTFAVFLTFLVWIAAEDVTPGALLAFLLAWLVPSALLYRRAAASRRRLHRT